MGGIVLLTLCKKSKALYKGDIMINFIKNKIISLFLNMIFYYVKYHKLIHFIIKVVSSIMDYLFIIFDDKIQFRYI